MRAGMLALKARSDAATRAGAAPEWADLLEQEAATWTLPEAIALAELIADPGPGDGDGDGCSPAPWPGPLEGY